MDTNNFADASDLSAEELELLLYLMEEEGIGTETKQRTIFPRAQQTDVPLSFAQERLWFVDQWEPNSPAYNIPFPIRLTGKLNAAALEWSLNEIISRHEVLRTTFPSVEGRPVQRIAPELRLTIPLVDLRELPEATREAEALRLAGEEAHHIFDLARGPLVHTVLFRIADDDHLFMLNIHHIVFDGWSTSVLIQEMIPLYTEFVTGISAALSEPLIQYADFAIWQREWLQGAVLEQQLGYWREQLRGPLPELDLPSDRPRPPVQRSRGVYHPFKLPLPLLEQLKALSHQEGTTLFMTLLAAFKTLIYRYTGQTDIIIGSPIANRDLVEIEHLIGYFINTLLLRTDLGGHPSFRKLLQRVREVTVGAYTHQNVPFEQLVEELRPVRDPSRTPLFQIMFILQNAPVPSYELPDLTLHTLEIENRTSKFDMTLSMTEDPTGLYGSIEYNSDLFDPPTIIRMLEHLEVLLNGIVADPDRPIAELPLLSEAERARMLGAWNPPTPSAHVSQPIHQMIAAQAARTPNAVAVMLEDHQLSYAELDQRANQLAHHLRALGVGGHPQAETRVALLLERTPDLIVSVLAVLKAGGAYVPLDPGYPTDRIQFILADAEIGVVLTQAQFQERLPAVTIPVVCVDRDWPEIAQAPTSAPEVVVDPAHLAYVIYTSGSLGRPKGVLVAHQSLVNYTEAAHDLYGITAADRVLQFASITFDASAEEIYPCLTRGGTLVLRTDEMLETPETFLRACQSRGVTVLSLPTAYWHQIAAQLAPAVTLPHTEDSGLRLLIIGGERALPERLAQWHEHVGAAVQVMNTYGPTEATIVATSAVIAGPDHVAIEGREVPIGKPLRNIQAYILDALLQPTPIGVPGELYLGGASLARGYLNRPDLTAEKFVPDPFSSERGARLYRTGDLVRFRADGEIEFVGRADQQVKVRGFRIELGEIESVLRQHAAVQDAVVLARQDEPGNARLVAYVVPQQNKEQTNKEQASNLASTDSCSVGSVLCSPQELRSHLSSLLPHYMVPSAFVFLDALPLTPAGKLDRRALPAPSQQRPELDKTFVAPRTPEEQALAAIWTDILRLEQIGVNDNFFELGGHSLLATQVVARVRQSLGVMLPLRVLFEQPTIAGLTDRINLIRWAAQEQPPPATEAAEDEEEGEV
jgi:amino acid adenylation domain-containing protein